MCQPRDLAGNHSAMHHACHQDVTRPRYAHPAAARHFLTATMQHPISIAAADYGADANGLICGFAFDQSGVGHAVNAQQALAALPALEAGHEAGFVWLHFHLGHASVERWLAEHLSLSPLFHEALREGSRSTRVELDDDTLIAVINDVHYDFAFEPSDISTLWLSVGPALVVSVRLKPLRSIDRLRESVRKGVRLLSPVELLVKLMHDQADVLVGIVRTATHQVDSIEDRLLSGRLESRRASLGSLRRLMVRLQRLLAPEPAALFRLLRKPPAWIHAQDIADLHQATEEFNVAIHDMGALQERIKLLQEEIAGRVAEANNRSLFVLTIVTVLALPINITAGLFGMNVGGIPWAENPHGFWFVMLMVASVTLVAAWLAFRKTGD